jgi:hypothetical protein
VVIAMGSVVGSAVGGTGVSEGGWGVDDAGIGVEDGGIDVGKDGLSVSEVLEHETPNNTMNKLTRINKILTPEECRIVFSLREVRSWEICAWFVE